MPDDALAEQADAVCNQHLVVPTEVRLIEIAELEPHEIVLVPLVHGFLDTVGVHYIVCIEAYHKIVLREVEQGVDGDVCAFVGVHHKHTDVLIVRHDLPQVAHGFRVVIHAN